MILKTVEVLVSLAAVFTAVRFLFFHSQGSRVRRRSFGIHDRERSIGIVMELLVCMTVLSLG
jgi:hypothetical protein